MKLPSLNVFFLSVEVFDWNTDGNCRKYWSAVSQRQSFLLFLRLELETYLRRSLAVRWGGDGKSEGRATVELQERDCPEDFYFWRERLNMQMIQRSTSAAHFPPDKCEKEFSPTQF